MIRGLHINSTAPFRLRCPGEEYKQHDFDILCTILSALKWRELNGSTKLYADSTAYAYYKQLGILDLWNEMDTEVMDNIPEEIDQRIFWAGSKLFAIQHEQVPFAVIDTDLVVWKPLGDFLSGKPLVVLHREPIHECYPPREKLLVREGYEFDPEWSWKVEPCNSAFTYYEDAAFKEEYTRASIDFMWNNKAVPKENVSQMVFAEQRILSMTAAKRNIPIVPVLDQPFDPDNEAVTHLWGAKDVARKNPRQNNLLCRALAKHIAADFPDYRYKHREMEIFKKYL